MPHNFYQLLIIRPPKRWPFYFYPFTLTCGGGQLQIKKQVVETTCESHEKTSIGNFWKIRGSCLLEKFISPEKIHKVSDQDN